METHHIRKQDTVKIMDFLMFSQQIAMTIYKNDSFSTAILVYRNEKKLADDLVHPKKLSITPRFQKLKKSPVFLSG